MSEKDDAVLVDLISKKVLVEEIAKQLPGRTALVCRLRYEQIRGAMDSIHSSSTAFWALIELYDHDISMDFR